MEKYLSNRWSNNPKWKKYAAGEGTIEGDAEPAAGEVTNETGDPAGNGAPPATELKPTQMYSRLQSELQAVRGQLAAEQSDSRHKVERDSRLQALSAEFIMDPADEIELTAEMNDVQFERHVAKTIKEHYHPDPVGPALARPPPAPRAPIAIRAIRPTTSAPRPRRTRRARREIP